MSVEDLGKGHNWAQGKESIQVSFRGASESIQVSLRDAPGPIQVSLWGAPGPIQVRLRGAPGPVQVSLMGTLKSIQVSLRVHLSPGHEVWCSGVSIEAQTQGMDALVGGELGENLQAPEMRMALLLTSQPDSLPCSCQGT